MVWCWLKSRYIDQWNGTERPEINPSMYGQLIFNNSTKSTQSERIVFSINDDWKTGYSDPKE